MSDEPGTVTARVDGELIRMARIICAHTPGRNDKQLKLVDFLDSLLRAPITERYHAILAEIARKQAEGVKPASERKRKG